MKLILWFTLLAGFAAQADVNDFICSSDRRPADGDLVSVAFEGLAHGVYGVYYTYEKGGNRIPNPLPHPQDPPDVDNQQITENLSCVASNKDERIRTCWSAGYTSETQIQLVQRSNLSTKDGVTTHIMIDTLEITVKSPTFPQRKFVFAGGDCILKD